MKDVRDLNDLTIHEMTILVELRGQSACSTDRTRRYERCGSAPFERGEASRLLMMSGTCRDNRIFIEVMTSDRKLKASREGSK